MTNAEHSAPVARGRRLRPVWLVLAAALCATVVAYVGYAVLSRSPWNSIPCTWDGVPAVLAAAVHSDLYKTGARGVAGLSSANPAEKEAAVYRISIDFLRGLTPQQVETFRRGECLRARQLSPAQLQPFIAIADATLPGSLAAPWKTWFWILSYHESFQFSWTNPPNRDGGMSQMVLVNLHADGRGFVAIPRASSFRS